MLICVFWMLKWPSSMKNIGFLHGRCNSMVLGHGRVLPMGGSEVFAWQKGRILWWRRAFWMPQGHIVSTWVWTGMSVAWEGKCRPDRILSGGRKEISGSFSCLVDFFYDLSDWGIDLLVWHDFLCGVHHQDVQAVLYLYLVLLSTPTLADPSLEKVALDCSFEKLFRCGKGFILILILLYLTLFNWKIVKIFIL